MDDDDDDEKKCACNIKVHGQITRHFSSHMYDSHCVLHIRMSLQFAKVLSGYFIVSIRFYRTLFSISLQYAMQSTMISQIKDERSINMLNFTEIEIELDCRNLNI